MASLNILFSNLSEKQVPLLHPWLKHRFLQGETTLQPKAGAGKEAHGCLEGCLLAPCTSHLIAWPHPGLRDASASLPSCTESLRKHASSNLQKDNCPENKFSFGVRDFLQCNFKVKLKFYTLTTKTVFLRLKKWSCVESTPQLPTFLSALLFMGQQPKKLCEASVKSQPDVLNKENASFARTPKVLRNATLLGRWNSGLVFLERPETSDANCPALLKFQNLWLPLLGAIKAEEDESVPGWRS